MKVTSIFFIIRNILIELQTYWPGRFWWTVIQSPITILQNVTELSLGNWEPSNVLIRNYWMRLSRIWRILQVEESVVTPSEICRIRHFLRKPNSIIALLFIQNIFFAQTCKLYSRPFLSSLNDTTLCPGFLGQWFNNHWRQWFNNLERAALLTSFWRQ